MVATCKVKTEAATNVVNNKNDFVLCAKLTNLFPEAVNGEGVIVEVTVIVRLSDYSGNFAFVFCKKSLEVFNVIPGSVKIVCNIFRSNTGIVNFLNHGRNTMI